MRRIGYLLALGLVVMVGVALRLAAARGDLWLDEIWSLLIASDVGSAVGVFTRVHHDNNHHLNTLYLLALGEGRPSIVYRLVAVLSGAGMIALVAAPPSRTAPRERITAAALLATSFILVQYTSEARGYGTAMFCALVAYTALDHHLRTGATRWAAVFALAASAGILSHLTFLFPMAGFVAWTAVDLARKRHAGWAGIALLALPLAVAALLWAVDVQYAVVGGGPPYRIADVIRELARATLGVPRGLLEPAAIVVAAAVAWEIARMIRAREPRAAFFVATAVAPAALLALHRPVFLAPRYFAVCVPFFLVTAAGALARLASRGTGGRIAYALLLTAFVAANLVALEPLLRDGRGHYREAIAFMRASSPEPVVTVGSDHDFRNRMVLSYYSGEQRGGKPIEYVPREAWTARRGPSWLVLHDAPQPASFVRAGGFRYALAAEFPHGGLSGWTWLVYRLTDETARGPARPDEEGVGPRTNPFAAHLIGPVGIEPTTPTVSTRWATRSRAVT